MSREKCPCGAGETYSTCCRPMHRGEREAADPAQLVRSRYSAFARKEVEYLWRTLAADHEDRAHPKEDVLRALHDSASRHRYMGLEILAVHATDDTSPAYVRFRARIFRDGRDVSFEEQSEFVYEGTGWRYLSGTIEGAK